MDVLRWYTVRTGVEVFLVVLSLIKRFGVDLSNESGRERKRVQCMIEWCFLLYPTNCKRKIFQWLGTLYYTRNFVK